MSLGNSTVDIVNLLPEVIATKILMVLQAIGGLFLIYLIYSIIKFYFAKKEFNIIREMQKDIKFIKNNIVKKKK